MKILVTGGTGFAGSHLITALISEGKTDVYTTTFKSPTASQKSLPESHYFQLDLSDKDQTATLIKDLQPDWIFHLASFAYVGQSFQKATELFANNIQLQLSLLNAVKEQAPHARVMTVGSAEEYGIVPPGTEKINESVPLNPINPYAVSKVTQDLLANSYFLSFGLNIIRARPFNHIGTRQTDDFAIPSFVKQIVAIERGEQTEMLVGNLHGVRDFTAVSDMARAYITLMEKGTVGQVYNIGTGVGTSMEAVVKMLCSYAKIPIVLKEDPSRIRPLDVPVLIADNTKIRALGWEPKQSIEATLQEILTFARDQI